jgi:hypothetical protein
VNSSTSHTSCLWNRITAQEKTNLLGGRRQWNWLPVIQLMVLVPLMKPIIIRTDHLEKLKFMIEQSVQLLVCKIEKNQKSGKTING